MEASQMLNVTLTSQRPWLASLCPSPIGAVAAISPNGVSHLPVLVEGHVIGGVSPVAALRPYAVQSQETLQAPGASGSHATTLTMTKPETVRTQGLQKLPTFDGFRGVPPRGRPV